MAELGLVAEAWRPQGSFGKNNEKHFALIAQSQPSGARMTREGRRKFQREYYSMLQAVHIEVRKHVASRTFPIARSSSVYWNTRRRQTATGRRNIGTAWRRSGRFGVAGSFACAGVPVATGPAL